MPQSQPSAYREEAPSEITRHDQRAQASAISYPVLCSRKASPPRDRLADLVRRVLLDEVKRFCQNLATVLGVKHVEDLYPMTCSPAYVQRSLEPDRGWSEPSFVTPIPAWRRTRLCPCRALGPTFPSQCVSLVRQRLAL
jgi:hypothetical protein